MNACVILLAPQPLPIVQCHAENLSVTCPFIITLHCRAILMSYLYTPAADDGLWPSYPFFQSVICYNVFIKFIYNYGLKGRRLISRQRDTVGAKKIKGTRLSARSIVGSVASSGGVHSGEALLLHQIVRYTICPKIGLKNAHLSLILRK